MASETGACKSPEAAPLCHPTSLGELERAQEAGSPGSFVFRACVSGEAAQIDNMYTFFFSLLVWTILCT